MQIKRTLPNNRNRGSVDDKGTVRGTWRPISLDWRMQSGVAFYDSTWWRYAKGLPPRDKCCRPFRSQLRIPIESLSRKTDKSEVIWADKSEWIGAWIIFDFEILVAAVLRRIRLLRKPDRFCCPFIRTVIDAICLIDTVTVSIPTAANLSLSLYGWFPFVGRGPKRNSEMGIVVGIIVVSIGRRAVRFVELRNEYDISAGRNSYGGTM